MRASGGYKVDLRAYLSACEANYRRLCRLLPADCDAASHRIALPGGEQALMTLAVSERCPYTTMLELRLQLPHWSQCFELRACHDASLLEITAFQQQRGIKPVYTYPNANMYQQDEKWQQQVFLSECLISCLQHGLASMDHLPTG